MADRAGVNVQTLRYYERRGLLPAPARRRTGYRVYGADAVRIVRFIKRSQQLGFTLSEVESLLHLAGGGPESCEAGARLAYQKISELDDKIAQLYAMRDALQQLLDTCERPARERECPLLHALDDPVGP